MLTVDSVPARAARGAAVPAAVRQPGALDPRRPGHQRRAAVRGALDRRRRRATSRSPRPRSSCRSWCSRCRPGCGPTGWDRKRILIASDMRPAGHPGARRRAPAHRDARGRRTWSCSRRSSAPPTRSSRRRSAGCCRRRSAPANLQPANALRGLTLLARQRRRARGRRPPDRLRRRARAARWCSTRRRSRSRSLCCSRCGPRVVDEALAEEDRGRDARRSARRCARAGARCGRGRWVLGFLGGFSVYHAVVLPAIFVIGPVLMPSELRRRALVGDRDRAVRDRQHPRRRAAARWRPAHALRVGALMLIGASCQAAIIGSHLPVWGIGVLELLTGICVTGMFTLWETSLGEHIPHRCAVAGVELRLPGDHRVSSRWATSWSAPWPLCSVSIRPWW